MRTNKEMRAEAWEILKTRWPMRIIGTYMLFMMIFFIVFGILRTFFEANGIQTWEAFSESYREAQAAGLDYAVPSLHQVLTMSGASAFAGFFQYLLTGIMMVGLATVLLNALKDRKEKWFSASLVGFKYPFGMLWLVLLMTIRVCLWSLLFFIPGVIAMFRYAVAAYVKSEHIDWSASQCLAESGRLMKGCKWRYVCFTFSYFGWMLLLALPSMILAALTPILPILALPSFIIFITLFAFVMVYIALGHAVFYEELKKHDAQPEESPCEACRQNMDSKRKTPL